MLALCAAPRRAGARRERSRDAYSRLVRVVVATLAVAPTRRRASHPAARATPTDSIFARARQLVVNGNGAAGRLLVDSMIAATNPDTPIYADALYWRATLAATSADAERDYRRLVVEYPLSPRAGDALLPARAARGGARRSRGRDDASRPLPARESGRAPNADAPGLMLVRLAFDQNDPQHGCVALRRALREVPATAVELRNQLDYYSPRCANVDTHARVAAAPRAASRDSAASRQRDSGDSDASRHRAGAARVESALHAAGRGVRLAGRRGRAREATQGSRRRRRESSGRREMFRVRIGHYETRAAAAAAATRAQGEEDRRVRHRDRRRRQVTTASQTPLMQQYREIKGRHQNAILFFRMGEFYEMFYDDAETASRVLGLTLTSRNNGGASDVPLAGVPVKAAGDYVRRLVQQRISRRDLRAGRRSEDARRASCAAR